MDSVITDPTSYRALVPVKDNKVSLAAASPRVLGVGQSGDIKSPRPPREADDLHETRKALLDSVRKIYTELVSKYGTAMRDGKKQETPYDKLLIRCKHVMDRLEKGDFPLDKLGLLNDITSASIECVPQYDDFMSAILGLQSSHAFGKFERAAGDLALVQNVDKRRVRPSADAAGPAVYAIPDYAMADRAITLNRLETLLLGMRHCVGSDLSGLKNGATLDSLLSQVSEARNQGTNLSDDFWKELKGLEPPKSHDEALKSLKGKVKLPPAEDLLRIKLERYRANYEEISSNLEDLQGWSWIDVPGDFRPFKP